MTDYVSYFVSSPNQILAILAVAVVWLGFTALGRPFTRGPDERVYAPIIGWAVVVGAYTLVGSLGVVPFTVIAMGLAAFAVGILLFYWTKDGGLFDPIWLRMLIVAGPLLFAVSGMQGSQWDEFSHWLIGQRYLLEVDFFPGLGRPASPATFPAYPYGWVVPSYLVSRVAGFHVENASALLNILLLLTLGRAALDMAARGCGLRLTALSLNPWVIAGLGTLVVTLLYPTFVQKVIFTAYADLATSVALAIAVILGVLALERTRDGLDHEAVRLLVITGLVLSTLVTLKQSTLELYLLGVIGLAAFALVSNVRNPKDFILAMSIIALPGLVLYFAWRAYVAVHLSGNEFAIRPIEDWFFDLAPGLLVLMATILLQKGYYLFAMLLGVVGGVRSLMSGTFYNRTMLVIGLVFLGHISFLLFAYLAIFGLGEARRAASFWRYNQQLGGLGALAIAMTGAHLLIWLDDRISVRRLAYLPIIAVMIVPLAVPHKIRFDRDPIYVHYRHVAAQVATVVGPDSRISIMDPHGSGESSRITKYEVRMGFEQLRVLSAYQDSSEPLLREFFEQSYGGWLLIFSQRPYSGDVIGVSLQPRTSYLFEVGDNGTLTQHGSWPWPAGMQF